MSSLVAWPRSKIVGRLLLAALAIHLCIVVLWKNAYRKTYSTMNFMLDDTVRLISKSFSSKCSKRVVSSSSQPLTTSALSQNPQSPFEFPKRFNFTQQPCSWLPGGPILFDVIENSIKGYSPAHWFHIAEQFVPLHAQYQKCSDTRNSNVVYIRLSPDRLARQLTAFTRMLMALGLANPQTRPVFFLSHASTLKLDSDIHRSGLLSYTANNIVHSIDFDQNTPEQRFVMVTQLYSPFLLVHDESPQIPKSIQITYSMKSTTVHRWICIQLSNHTHIFCISFPGPLNPCRLYGGSASRALKNVCTKYMGRDGDAHPAVPRSQWFPTPKDIETFQATFKAFCFRESRSSNNVTIVLLQIPALLKKEKQQR